MASESVHELLEKFFSRSDREAWREVAMRETDGKDPDESLAWHSRDNILLKPYYDAADTVRLSASGTQGIAATAHTWANLPSVVVIKEGEANITASEHIASGADGVFFDLQHLGAPDLTVLLRNLCKADITLAFARYDDFFPDRLREFVSANGNIIPGKLFLFGERVPASISTESWAKGGLGVLIPGSTPAEEISEALFMGAQTVERLRHSTDPARVFAQIAFSVPVNADFSETVAKFRALRVLWREVAAAYGQHDYKEGDLHVHARSGKVSDGAYGPHENMLKATFASIAAICGGCNSLTVESDAQPALVPRQARNISAILREEAFLGEISDPLAGAYAIEAITCAIAEKAWQLFQDKWTTL